MNEQNFDKILKQKMAEERDFPFSEDKWDKMERKLDDFHDRKRYERLAWASALSFAGLLGVLIFVASQLQDTKSNLANLTQAIQQSPIAKQPFLLDSIQKGSVIKRDTVYHHIIVKRYDTIFQTVVQRPLSQVDVNRPKDKNNDSILNEKGSIEANITIKKPQIVTSIQNGNQVTDSSNAYTHTGRLIDSSNQKPIVQLQDTSQNEPLLAERGFNNSNTTPINKILAKDNTQMRIEKISEVEKNEKMDSVAIGVPPLSIGEEKAANQRKPILKPLNLNGYEIGLSSGSAFIGDKDIQQQMGYSAGFRGSVGLGQRFKVVGEAQLVGSHYKLKDFSSRSDIPTVNPPTANDDLSSIQVRQSSGRVFLGVQYDMTRSRLRPFVGVGAVGAIGIEEKYRFKFINRLTNEGTVMSAQNRSKDFDEVYWRVSAGLSYPILKKLKVQMEGSFDAPFNHKHDYQPLLQLRGAVLYRF